MFWGQLYTIIQDAYAITHCTLQMQKYIVHAYFPHTCMQACGSDSIAGELIKYDGMSMVLRELFQLVWDSECR